MRKTNTPSNAQKSTNHKFESKYCQPEKHVVNNNDWEADKEYGAKGDQDHDRHSERNQHPRQRNPEERRNRTISSREERDNAIRDYLSMIHNIVANQYHNQGQRRDIDNNDRGFEYRNENSNYDRYHQGQNHNRSRSSNQYNNEHKGVSGYLKDVYYGVKNYLTGDEEDDHRYNQREEGKNYNNDGRRDSDSDSDSRREDYPSGDRNEYYNRQRQENQRHLRYPDDQQHYVSQRPRNDEENYQARYDREEREQPSREHNKGPTSQNDDFDTNKHRDHHTKKKDSIKDKEQRRKIL